MVQETLQAEAGMITTAEEILTKKNIQETLPADLYLTMMTMTEEAVQETVPIIRRITTAEETNQETLRAEVGMMTMEEEISTKMNIQEMLLADLYLTTRSLGDEEGQET